MVHYGIPDAWPAPKQIKVCQGIYASHTGRGDECPQKDKKDNRAFHIEKAEDRQKHHF
ncbi:hypothetical protein SDC9_200818 [bioreactor metagenome]|uniref:Uncharacterized protein n=1 Tax=bioreactor metagenome TaxID=1076179 RepID=A0A645IXQ0_9ZZZZ